jgi:hypothetical protein
MIFLGRIVVKGAVPLYRNDIPAKLTTLCGSCSFAHSAFRSHPFSRLTAETSDKPGMYFTQNRNGKRRWRIYETASHHYSFHLFFGVWNSCSVHGHSLCFREFNDHNDAGLLSGSEWGTEN